MPYLITRNEFDAKIKPAGPLRINPNSELALGLRHFYVCDATGATDLVYQQRFKASADGRGVGVFGEAWSPNGGSYIACQTSPVADATGAYRVGSGITAVVAGKFSTASSHEVPLGNCNFNSIGGWCMKSTIGGTGNVGVTSFGGMDDASSIPTPTTDGTIFSVVLETGGTDRFRVNNTTGTGANAAQFSVGDTISIGSASRYSTYGIDAMSGGTLIYWAAIYNRAITVAEQARIHNGPFGDLVVHAIPRTYFFVSGGAGNLTLALTGVSATGATGSLTTSRTVGMTGATSTSATGTIASGTSKALTGVAGTGSVGSVTSSRTIPLTSAVSTGATGSISVSRTIPVSGVQITAALGTLSPGVSLSMTGTSIAAAQGSMPSSSTIGLVGSESIGGTGTITVAAGSNVTVGLTGVSATFSLGSLGVAATIPLTGANITTAQGTLVVDRSVGMSGVSSTSALGNLGNSRTVALTGAGISGATGVFATSGGTPVISESQTLAGYIVNVGTLLTKR